MKKSTPRILWDFRLFSTGYANRGVGTYCRSLCEPMLAEFSHTLIFIWGNKEHAPEFLNHYKIHWIPYKYISWKYDILRIPFLLLKYKIDIIHYWVLFGPLLQCSIGIWHPCKSIATVHDLGVEYWDVPYLNAIRKSMYWKCQKLLSSSISTLCTTSKVTSSDCFKYLSRSESNSHVVYMPQKQLPQVSHLNRKPYFIALGGSPHKNSANVIKAFKQFLKKKPAFMLIFLGDLDNDEQKLCIEEHIQNEVSMNQYIYHLQHASAMIFCSFYEGLGIPPLEAMQQGCPLIVSDIPSLNETCKGAALFIDPHDPQQIERAMDSIVDKPDEWSQKSYEGARNYFFSSHMSVKKCVTCYNDLYVQKY